MAAVSSMDAALHLIFMLCKLNSFLNKLFLLILSNIKYVSLPRHYHALESFRNMRPSQLPLIDITSTMYPNSHMHAYIPTVRKHIIFFHPQLIVKGQFYWNYSGTPSLKQTLQEIHKMFYLNVMQQNGS